MFLENADQIIYSLALAFNYAVMLNGLITYFIPPKKFHVIEASISETFNHCTYLKKSFKQIIKI